MSAEVNIKQYIPAFRYGIPLTLDLIDVTDASLNQIIKFDGTEAVWADDDGLTSVYTDGLTILGDGTVNSPLTAVTQQTGKGILTGGAVWSGTGFTFDVTSLTYYIDGVTYGPTTQTSVTLAASDPSDPRFDVIVVDDAGVVSVVTGTPNTPPAVPEVAWNQVPVTIVLVEAGSTTPTITQDLIYNENTGTPTEWATSVYNIAGTQTGTVVFNSANVPYNGAVCAQATGTNLRRGMRFTRATDINIQQFGYISLAFRIDSSPLPTTKSPIIRFQNSGGTLIGNSVNLVTYGLQRTVINTWQLLVIPVTAFGNITNVRSLTALVNGSGNADWSMDLLFLSGGIPPQSNLGPIFLSATGTLYSAGAAQGGGSGVNDSIFFGEGAGSGATGVYSSIFLGDYAGFKATNAFRSQFIGEYAGYGATGAQDSQFIGQYAGYGATTAVSSLFAGSNAGYGATNASQSVFLGQDAGKNATDAASSIFIGYQAGINDTTLGSSILIGNSTSTGGFAGSIALGNGATNTSVLQLMIGSGTNPINEVVVYGTGGIQVPVGTTAERIATQGMIRYNTSTNKFEGYDGTTWQDFY